MVAAFAEGGRPAGREVWFVLVLDNGGSLLGGPHLMVQVFYTPDEQSPRARRGRCTYLEKPGFFDDEEKRPAVLREYAQVAPAGKPLPPLSELPEVLQRPFLTGQDRHGHVVRIADEDLATLVAAGRAAVGKRGAGNPVYQVTTDGEVYEVRVGSVHGSMAGRCEVVTFKRMAGKFVRVGGTVIETS